MRARVLTRWVAYYAFALFWLIFLVPMMIERIPPGVAPSGKAQRSHVLRQADGLEFLIPWLRRLPQLPHRRLRRYWADGDRCLMQSPWPRGERGRS